ncbi:glycosyltransferase family 2 protein [Pectobacterium aroidearum]|uniref:glycosyltransferase family 2 protein n=1 Tax=Pectobacterium aroidearum TaxID=1201031 RepID=UPI002113A022|nr:glycosyltransferase family 2 protein [Pectobacterium aroidearum]UUE35075.1 glycosyltransferase family 2 protein [Pectobacterium aroidearum]UUE39453.1 glycosyltransferase family 2 protein [Pectobacterium aroidearum]
MHVTKLHKHLKINVAVVSHRHYEIIKSLNCLPRLANKNDIKVCIIDNVGEPNLEVYCKEYSFSYIKNFKLCGFGENNNKVFDFFYKNKEDFENSYFLVLNPDVDITIDNIRKLAREMHAKDIQLSTVNLFKDANHSIPDNSIRIYPELYDFFSSFILKKNKTIINKNLIETPCPVDWAAGSFLMFSSSLYEKLLGFDESYFMYCEDIDICLRSNLLHGQSVVFFPDIKATHYAAHENRRFFSKNFLWHTISIVKFLFKKKNIYPSAKDGL